MRTFSRELHHVFIPHPENQDRPYILRTPSLTFFGGLLLAFKIWLVFVLSLYPLLASFSTITANRIIELTNESRETNSLEPLSTNSLLEKAAEAKARDMLQKDYFAHVSPSGKEPWDFILEAGYDYIYAGENLAINFQTAEGVHEALMQSPTHRDNILSENFTEIGIAVMSGDYKGVETTVVIEIFGSTKKSLVKILKNKEIESDSSSAPSETTPAKIPPSPPIITLPKNGDFVSTFHQKISGRALALSTISFYINNEKIGQVKADGTGNFEGNLFVFLQNFKEGPYSIKTRATGVNGLESDFSSPVSIIIDLTPPEINLENSYLLPLLSFFGSKIYLSLNTKDEILSATAYFNDRIQNLEKSSQKNIYESIFNFPLKDSDQPNKIRIKTTDLARNQKEEVFSLNSPTFILASMPENNSYLVTLSLKNKFTRFALITLIIFIVLLVINILVRIRYQHYPTIAKVIIFLAFVGILLII